MKRLLAFFLALTLVMGLLPAIAPEASAEEAPETYTYNTYMPNLGGCWNPHTWATSADSEMMSYLESPLANLTIKDSEMGEYQWIFVAATDIQDVTAEHQDDLVKYGCAETEATAGYVFEISLREEMKWQDGTPINADTYIYSMKALLDPAMRNYRAGSYTDDADGDGALAGAYNYVYQGSSLTFDGVDLSTLVKGEDGVYTTQDGKKVWIALETELDWLGDSLQFYVDYYGDAYFDLDAYATLRGMADENGNVAVTDESLATLLAVISVPAWGEGAGYEGYYICYEEIFPVCSFEETVGLYKVDDYTIRYVCANYCDYYYFLTSCTSNWLVYEKLYEAGKDTSGELVTTNYGTSFDTTMSYGAYRMESLIEGNQVVFVQNENYWEYTRIEDGTLSSVTFFEVDGAYVPQYQTTRVVIDVISAENAEQAFLSGQLDEWAPPADELGQYMTSDQLYQVDETYTYRLFFHTNLDSLKAMDLEGNQNSVVLSNDNFRKAMSLAIDRADWVTATSGYKPAIGLLNTLYYYDVYRDPSSVYRYSDEAMQAICNLYGVEYGEGTPYATLRDAYKSITGYDPEEAKALFTTACQELVDAGLYTAGDPITIQIAYAYGDLTSSAAQQVALLEGYINAAFEGTGFGTFTLTPIDNLDDRYGDVMNGVYAIGCGAWGGAAFYPFSTIGVYTDPSSYPIHEIGCWDPSETMLTLTVNGEEVTMSYTEWYQSINYGIYADAEMEVKLTILAGLEQNILNLYYCIPLASRASAYLLSYQVSYYTEEYNIMYGFGGLRLMRYNYSDTEWAAYVESVGGILDYGQDTTPSGPAILASGTCGENVTWTLDENGLLTISGTGEMENYSFDGAPWYSYASDISAVIMEDGVTTIGDFAFFECSSMTDITISDNITSIGSWAFAACVNLTGIAIPNAVTSIGVSAFRACSGLESITIPSSVTTIYNFAFAGCSGLTEITIPESVTSIGDMVFYGCDNLTEIYFEGDAPSFGESVFDGRTATVYYPAGNETWTDDVMLSYGGTITWVSYDPEDRCANGHTYEAVIKEPTCTEYGYTTYTCIYCGDSYQADFVYSSGHSPWEIVTMPTFDAPGEAVLNCEKCGLSDTVVLPQKQSCEPWANLTEILSKAVSRLDYFFELNTYFMMDTTNNYFLNGIDYGDSVCVPKDLYLSVMQMYFAVEDDIFEQLLAQCDNENDWAMLRYDEEQQMFIIRNSGGMGGSMASRQFIGFAENGDTYDVYYATILYGWLSDVLPEGTSAYEYAESLGWPSTIEYEGIEYQAGPDGYYVILGYENSGKKYTVEKNGDVVRIISCTEFTEDDVPEHLHYQTKVEVPSTCTEQGYVEYVCDCGYCGPRISLDPTEHNYVDGVCVDCGEAEAEPEDPAYVTGDVNGDGRVDYLDAMVIAQYYVGLITDEALNAAAADVNGDGRVDYLDAMMVAQFYVGLLDSFPAEN